MKILVKYMGVVLLLLLMCGVLEYIDSKHVDTRMHQHQTVKEIPVIEIETNQQKIMGKSYYSPQPDGSMISVHEPSDNITVDFTYRDENGKEIKESSLIHIRGNSSRWFEKSSYILHLIDDKENPVERNLANMGKYNEWVLNGPYLDKTLIRNYMCMNIAGEIMDYAPEVAFVHLYIDGEDQGLYLLMESIARDSSRLELTKSSQHAYATSYIVGQDRDLGRDIVVNTFSNYTYRTGSTVFCLNYPGVNSFTEKKLEYIREDLSAIEKKLYSYDLKTHTQDYIEDIDLQSFADYFIINEFFGNMDAGFYSTYFYKDVRGKLKTCVWDFNNACDNYMENPTGVEGFHLQNAPWFEQLLKDPRFVELVLSRYEELRGGVLSDEYLQNYMTETIQWLGENITMNYKIWGRTFRPELYNKYDQGAYFLSPISRNPSNYNEAVKQLREYVRERGNWLDEYIVVLKQYCHLSRTINETLQ